MSKGPLAALCLCRTECVEHWRTVMGPQEVIGSRESTPLSIQALFGEDLTASAALPSALLPPNKQINLFFPGLTLDPMLQDEAVRSYLNNTVIPTLLPALAQLSNERPNNPIMWLADWLTLNNPYQPTPEPHTP